MRNVLGILIAIVALFPATLSTVAQNQRLAFEVASIKLNTSATSGGFIRPTGDRLIANNVPLKVLVVYAYRASDGSSFLNNQLFGGPVWMDKDRFDVEAKAAVQPRTVDEFRPMVQALLEERFKLKVHRETRDLPVYNMVVEKSGLKNMKLSEDQSGVTGPSDASKPPRGTPWMDGETSASGTMLVLSGNAVGLARLATTLQGLVQRPVIDRTNLNGFFDFPIRFSPQAIPAFPDRVPTADGLPAAPSDHPLIPILQEEFGLKLQPGKGPVEVLVVDHAEKPTEN
jgi:uncharacterized protein (TIGR03435 family)